MENIEKQRLENKLKLWDTPGFSQFLADLEVYLANDCLVKFADVLRKGYINRLNELKPKSKYKQGKLL